ncbi:hypothetical protein N8I77_001482 [Diaporthe amygdali]|uniref:Uncharacterized protein n=1 Tax=Phomopsis amygdali TaxID=1214568 RepID=A0AAD9SQM5_PHOAM|nr:uncharacterized protein J7T55_012984 [Diaporthe amygdali]KAJ0118730.1 hypothetical protein J7T55_012984 [Diaporthe amygdali]KAK2614676.1 hypothetical protein N8I77_001482 [Diaporthe amygdali]
MKYSFVAFLAASASAAPLNINLGAYSPALVVGDGEISFAGAQGAEGLVNTLQGAAAASNGAVAQGQAVAPAAAAPAGEGLQQASVINEPVRSRSLGVTKELDPRQEAEDEEDEDEVAELEAREDGAQEGGLMKRQNGFDRALTYAEAALQKGPKIQLGTPAAGVGIIVDNNQQAAGAVTPAE